MGENRRRAAAPRADDGGAPAGRGPVRTCVGCGRRREKAELLRFTRPSGEAPFIGPSPPGRGYYVCTETGCLERLERRLGRLFNERERARALEGLRAAVEMDRSKTNES